ncbi:MULTISPECIES: tetratricopeptide repeat protein [Kosmotoga]|uniref:TPR repeat-containing protein n=1 Tax=Kosmotoga olearia (strain ATCC BAA-1733 / DSM 21960 / TBF 19.5.1) TaxID=521045 RepID=C5CE35_KOSOT|nr:MULTISPECIES: tetratricopeptide repeat protein [Kosmotoga]ACR80137.1 hypothetical protein Kole_1445 [Kosmotoga olearia TBF 19.5.1]MDI3523728.1 hypothetical protein [Kosmotoga sp.]MDK2953212.1 hypothetical protein [Kosmotoga sp.]OAA20327.1 hypothetical protein DU53_07985 [Kosmotoga sp. DU53]
MKKILLMGILLMGLMVVAASFDELWERFVEIRSYQDTEAMKTFIEELENDPQTFEDVRILALYADCLREYANWIEGDAKKEYYEKARKYAEEAIEMDPNYGYSYYVAGAAIGQLAQYEGIVKSLFMLGDFDKYIKKAMELMPDNPFPIIAMAMRYRDTPWPFKDFEKSEELFMKAIRLDPKYVNAYLELAILYDKWKKYDNAARYYRKVVTMPLHPNFIKAGEKSKEEAKEWLEEHGYGW